jgi:hypothetical protein
MFRSLRLPNLPKFLTFKDLPEPFNHLAKPLVLVSVGLHTALLFAPIPSPPSKTKPVEPKPKTVKITTLPPLKSKSLAQPKLSSKTLRKPLASSATNKQLVIQSPKKKAQNQVPNQKPQTTPSKPAPVEEESSDPNNPMNDFPRYPGAIPNCYGFTTCFQTDKPLDLVSQFFQKELPKRKYTLTPDAVESDRKVFKFSKGGSQQFLNIYSEGQTSFYLLASEAMKRSDIQNAVQVPPSFNNIMSSLPPVADGESTDASPDQFTSPTDFFSELGGDAPDGTVLNPKKKDYVDTIRLVRGQTPEQLLSRYFTQSGFQPKSIANFGGGQLYEVKKGTFNPFYLNLVPAQGNKGTIVVVWLRNPS